MLPIHTGGTKGTVRSKFFQMKYARLLVNSLFVFRASPGPNSLREARVIVLLVPSKPEQWTTNIIIFFFFPYVVQLVQFYCIKNRLLSRAFRGTLEELDVSREVFDTRSQKPKQRKRKKESKEKEEEKSSRRSDKFERTSRSSFPRFFRIARHFERPARLARLSNYSETFFFYLSRDDCFFW